MNELIKVGTIRQCAIDWFELFIPWSRDCDPIVRKKFNMHRNQAFADAKDLYRDMVHAWGREYGLAEHYVRSEFNFRFTGRYQAYDGVRIEPGMTSIHNGLGGLGSSLWLNKVSIGQDGEVVSSRATTDPMFLEPFPTKFQEWLTFVNRKLMEPITIR